VLTTTARGQRLIRTAIPTPAFWGLWRSQKDEVRSLGINPRLNGEAWEVIWYAEVPAPTAAKPVSAPVVSPAVKALHDAILASKPWSTEQLAIFAWFMMTSVLSSIKALVVRARAGTGKTTTIKAAVTLAPEVNIIYLAFNTKNAAEAKRAIDDPRVDVLTLHSLGRRFIQAVWGNVIATKESSRDLENERVEVAVGKNAPREVKAKVKKLVSFAKNMLGNATIQEMVELAQDRDIECPQYESPVNGGWTVNRLASAAMTVLEISKERDPQGRITFDDMVWLPNVMGWVRAWFDLVVVDEAQDMNMLQLTMAMNSVKPGGRICVVGDDRQAIYGFRGACQDGLDMMKSRLNAAELGLTVTRRCPKSTVRLVNPIVPDFKAADEAPEGLVESINDSVLADTVKVGDAILSRSNAPLMPICLSLLRKGVAARIEGKDVGQQLAAIVDRVNARTVPQFMVKVEVWGEKQKNRFLDTKHYEEKAIEIDDNVAALKAIAEGSSSVSEIRDRITRLFQDSDEATAPAVVLSSVHKAKGGEWANVFILIETFNRKRPLNAAPETAEQSLARAREEANIYYVALTRVMQKLTVVSGGNH
jgi:superfamily I DNA/RNA helicase